MDAFSLNKVVWRDGDVITEKHFQSQEQWIENVIGLSNQHLVRYGLFRNPTLQENFNKDTNLTFNIIEETQHRETQYQIGMEKFLALNPYGRFLLVDDFRTYNLRIPLSRQNEAGYILVYLVPKEMDWDKFESDENEVYTGVRTYLAECELSTSNPNNNGVPILRFKVVSGHIYKDEEFIPFGIRLDSSSFSTNAHRALIEKFENFKKLLEDYFYTLRPTANMLEVWHSVSMMYRILQEFEPILTGNKSMPTIEFFKEFKKFLNLFNAEINILLLAYNDERHRNGANDAKIVLNESFEFTDAQYDLTLSFAQAMKILDALTTYVGYLPEGPITEKQLQISKVDFSKVAGSNKLTVYLSEKLNFKKGDSILSIYLRSYTRAEPMSKNVRVGLGDIPYPLLKDIQQGIKPIQGENLSYIIICPQDQFESTTTSSLTIYVPTPIGEGVPDLTRSMSITIREQ